MQTIRNIVNVSITIVLLAFISVSVFRLVVVGLQKTGVM
jgi:hypothetical protein